MTNEQPDLFERENSESDRNEQIDGEIIGVGTAALAYIGYVTTAHFAGWETCTEDYFGMVCNSDWSHHSYSPEAAMVIFGGLVVGMVATGLIRKLKSKNE